MSGILRLSRVLESKGLDPDETAIKIGKNFDRLRDATHYSLLLGPMEASGMKSSSDSSSTLMLGERVWRRV